MSLLDDLSFLVCLLLKNCQDCLFGAFMPLSYLDAVRQLGDGAIGYSLIEIILQERI